MQKKKFNIQMNDQRHEKQKTGQIEIKRAMTNIVFYQIIWQFLAKL